MSASPKPMSMSRVVCTIPVSSSAFCIRSSGVDSMSFMPGQIS